MKIQQYRKWVVENIPRKDRRPTLQEWIDEIDR